MIYDECSRFLPLSYPPPARIPLRPTPSRANEGLGAGAYFPSPLFSRLHDLASLSFFFPRSSVSLPAFLLSRPPPSPNHRSLFRRPRRRRRRVVTPRIFSSYFAARSTPSDASRHSHAVLLATPTSFPFIPQIERHKPPPCSLAAFGATLDSSARRRINGKNKYG